MKYLVAIALMFSSLVVAAQDISFQLCNAKCKKWVGANIYTRTAAENTTTLTFNMNHTVVEGDRRYNSTKPPVKWWLATGEYMKDNNIIIQIGEHSYYAEFSRTNNGKDFLTLIRVPEQEGEEKVIKTYVAE